LAAALVGVAGCSLQQPLQQANQSQATVGKPAPDFAGTDLDGMPVSLSDYRGHPLVINFWASWCGPCRAEQSGIERALVDYAPQGLQVLGITVRDNLEAARIFRDEFKMPYRSLFDQAARLEFAYQVDAPPSSIFIDATGIVRFKITGALSEAGLKQLIIDKLHLR
jgi:peroxiredoxin